MDILKIIIFILIIYIFYQVENRNNNYEKFTQLSQSGEYTGRYLYDINNKKYLGYTDDKITANKETFTIKVYSKDKQLILSNNSKFMISTSAIDIGHLIYKEIGNDTNYLFDYKLIDNNNFILKDYRNNYISYDNILDTFILTPDENKASIFNIEKKFSIF